jgi:hypothetical protein
MPCTGSWTGAASTWTASGLTNGRGRRTFGVSSSFHRQAAKGRIGTDPPLSLLDENSLQAYKQVLIVRPKIGRIRPLQPRKSIRGPNHEQGRKKMALFRYFGSNRRRDLVPFRPTLVELEPRILLAVDVLTYHNDIGRTGQNLAETVLTPANVNAADFGKLFTDPVDGAVYAEPLYKSGVVVPGRGTLNLVFVATEHDSVYAFNADSPGPPVWQASFSNPAAGVTSVPAGDVNGSSLGPEVGITGTPVIDPVTSTLYVVAFTREISAGGTAYVQRLHALDLAIGAEKFGGPVVIGASVPGTGQGSSGGIVSFDAFRQNQRPALLLDNNVVYIAWASFGDLTPYHGWVIGYNAQTLQQVAAFNTTPNGGLGGIWQSGDGPAADAAGNLYVLTGNGTFDANSTTPPQNDYGDSFVKLSPNGGNLSAADYFAPYNQATLNSLDEDLGSGGPLVLPDQPGPYSRLLIGAGKQGTIYVLNRDALGGFSPLGDNILQELPGAITAAFDTPAYFNDQVYFAGVNDVLKAFALAGGVLSTSPTSQSSEMLGYPGATPSISANGAANGMVWIVEDSGPAILRAYSAGNLATELYDSNRAGARDQLGLAVKFAVPMIANGKVFVGTQSGLTVFGLLPAGPGPSPHGPAGTFVTQVYTDQLGRSPDSAGLASWSGQLNQGFLTRTQVAAAIETSQEYATAEVQRIYAQFLQRSPDPNGLSTWTAFLEGGGTLVQLEAEVAGSQEYFQNRGGATTAGFLNALYADVFGHGVDPQGQATWSQALANGSSRPAVAAAIFASTEYLQDLVESYYLWFLRRSADANGLAGWVAALQRGMTAERVMAAFIGSDEYFSRLQS